MRRLTLFLLLLTGIAGNARGQFVTSGNISYERKVNLHRQYDEEPPDWVKRYVPKMQTATFAMAFNEAKSSYTADKENSQSTSPWSPGVATGLDNNVYQDYKSKTVAATKQIFEQRFIVRDSARKVSWRILKEERTIAGYQCRKAVTRICDSVYVVAFYAYDIPVSGGPEQFGGLPGMILELAVPRLYATWVATNVESVAVTDKDIKTISGKGKSVNRAQLMQELSGNSTVKSRVGERGLWWNSL
jgi:GLPGLI family protein